MSTESEPEHAVHDLALSIGIRADQIATSSTTDAVAQLDQIETTCGQLRQALREVAIAEHIRTCPDPRHNHTPQSGR